MSVEWKVRQLTDLTYPISALHSTKKLSSLTRLFNLPIFTANKTISNLTQYESSQEASDLLKAGSYFYIQSEKIWKPEIFPTFEIFVVCFLTILNSRKLKVRSKRISRILLILNFTTRILIHVYYVNYVSILGCFRKNNDIFLTRPDKGNGVVILDRKSYNNGIE